MEGQNPASLIVIQNKKLQPKCRFGYRWFARSTAIPLRLDYAWTEMPVEVAWGCGSVVWTPVST